jgi:hypothetical protein
MKTLHAILFSFLCLSSPSLANDFDIALEANLAACKTEITALRTPESVSLLVGTGVFNGASTSLFSIGGKCRVSETLENAIKANPRDAGQKLETRLTAEMVMAPSKAQLLQSIQAVNRWPSSILPLRNQLGINKELGVPERWSIGSVVEIEQAFYQMTPNNQSPPVEYTSQAALAILPLAIYSDAADRVRTLSISDVAIGEALVEAVAQDKKWRSYHFGGGSSRVQLPWELLLNDSVLSMSPLNRDYFQCVDESRRPNAIARACPLPPPPSRSIAFLHPTVGVTPFDTKGKSSGVVGVLEVIGLNCWTYDSNTFDRADEWTISAVGVYAPATDRRDWSPGILVRTPYSGVSLVWSQANLRNGGTSNSLSLSVNVNALVRSQFDDKSLKKSLMRIFGGGS